MDKELFSILAFSLMALTFAFFIRSVLRGFQFAASAHWRLRLHAPDAEPSLHIEALLLVTGPFALRRKRAEVQAFLEGLATRTDCGGVYDELMAEVEKATSAYHALPASRDEADIVMGAMLIRKQVEDRLVQLFDDKLKAFGLRVYGVSKCALGNRPPERVA